jgi:hypothetical protein
MPQLRIASAQRQRVYRPGGPIAISEIAAFAPSVFAEEAHASRSERYGFVDSAKLLSTLSASGFDVFEVRQQISRVADKQNFGTHMLRFRHRNAQNVSSRAGDPAQFEIIMLNSHAGQTCFNLYAGVFRMVCRNGLIAGNVVEGMKVQHNSNAFIGVEIAMEAMLETAPRVTETVRVMQEQVLRPIEQQALAMHALSLRWPGDTPSQPHKAPITIDQVLEPRRREDTPSDVWSVFNRLQEKLTKGGVEGRTANGRATTTRPVVGVQDNLTLNRELFRAAEAMVGLAA